MPANWIALLILGVVAGILSGMFGIGGGTVIVPILVALFGFDLQSAVGTSLGALLMPVGVFAVIAYYRAGKFKVRTAAWVAFGLLFGSGIGAKLAFDLPVKTVQTLYGVFLLYASWRFVEPRKWYAELRHGAPPALPVTEATSASWYLLLAVGLGAGVASGLFGIGGGIVIVPALVGLLRFEQKVAVGTSLGALLLPVSLPAAITYYTEGKLVLLTSAMVAIGLVFGAFGGAKIALGLPSSTVKRLYGIFLLFIGLRFILGG